MFFSSKTDEGHIPNPQAGKHLRSWPTVSKVTHVSMMKWNIMATELLSFALLWRRLFAGPRIAWKQKNSFSFPKWELQKGFYIVIYCYIELTSLTKCQIKQIMALGIAK